MDKQTKAKQFLRGLMDAHPKDFFKKVDNENRGLHLILHLLNEANGTVVAGDISDALGMSTPRVAAALKALEAKGYIVRKRATDDKRKTEVVVTAAGRAAAKRDEDCLIELVTYLFDAVGDDDLNEFLRISSAISSALDKRNNTEV